MCVCVCVCVCVCAEAVIIIQFEPITTFTYLCTLMLYEVMGSVKTDQIKHTTEKMLHFGKIFFHSPLRSTLVAWVHSRTETDALHQHHSPFRHSPPDTAAASWPSPPYASGSSPADCECRGLGTGPPSKTGGRGRTVGMGQSVIQKFEVEGGNKACF